jgi:chorismate--pyruvate lyase
MMATSSGQLEPDWRYRSHLRRSGVSDEMQTWLFHDASLTTRLKAGCQHGFRVEVLRQRYARVQINEERLLGMPHRQNALLREVYLYCGNVRVVYARSIIPLKTLTGKQRQLAYLGERPLGGFLFSCPSMQRGQVQLAQIPAGNPVYNRAMDSQPQQADNLWGRRSVFRLDGKPLIVAEIFLPAINQMVTGGING